jgi:hypothetical protein
MNCKQHHWFEGFGHLHKRNCKDKSIPLAQQASFDLQLVCGASSRSHTAAKQSMAINTTLRLLDALSPTRTSGLCLLLCMLPSLLTQYDPMRMQLLHAYALLSCCSCC